MSFILKQIKSFNFIKSGRNSKWREAQDMKNIFQAKNAIVINLFFNAMLYCPGEIPK